ncbi:MAG TPA: FecR domain-containing protein [Cytophagaceae bacterium]|jgi:transmembrane sensor|nr:FecR domain-containing protein [Cytophagaceae bacterium]
MSFLEKIVYAFQSSAWMRVSITLVLIAATAVLLKYTMVDAPEPINFATLENKMEIYLPDSSKVFLNKNSQITYYTDYNKEERKVYLDGEAFFEIKKIPNKIFDVITLRASTTSYGASVSVRSRENEKEELVQVVVGDVSFADKNYREKDKIMIPSGYKGELDQAGHLVKSKIIDSNFIAWKTNHLVFDKTSLAKVVEDLEAYFGVSVEVLDDQLLASSFSGTFEEPTLQEVMEVLSSYSNSTYKITGDKVILFSKRTTPNHSLPN